MSFFLQLKAQADVLRDRGAVLERDLQALLLATEGACQVVGRYFNELAAQLEVIRPPAAVLSLDDRTAWPEMAARDFRCDARKKTVRDQKVHASVSMGWRIVPREGEPVDGVVSVDFPIELERVQTRLAQGGLEHQRTDVRHPQTGKLQAIRFEYATALRASVVATPDHDQARVHFRLHNVTGFGARECSYPAASIDSALLDELARLLVQAPGRFLQWP